MKKTTLLILISLYGNALLLAQSGSFDPTFGTNGIKITPVNSKDVYTSGLSVNQNNKILSAGSSGEDTYADMFVLRQNIDGSLDPLFGTGGKKILSISPTNDVCTFMKLDGQDRIYVGGYGWKTGQGNNVEVARLHSDGSLDLTFAGTGYISADFNTFYDYAYDLAIQQDGKLVIAGGTIAGDDEDVLVVRYLPSDLIDTSFNHTGWAKFDIWRSDEARYVTMLPDQRILVLGVSGSANPLKTDIILLQLLPNGTADPQFGNNGSLIVGISPVWNYPAGMVLLNDGKILIGGTIGTKEFGLIRLNANGTFDGTFGINGVVTQVIANVQNNSASAFTLQEDGKILMAGFSGKYPDYQSCIARFNVTGSLDSGFADNGVLFHDLSDSTNYWTNIVAISNERVLVSGNANNSMLYDHAIAKLISNLSVGVLDVEREINELLVYPNPFNAFETLEYSLTKSQKVKVSLYDNTGRYIQTLVPESERNAGMHREFLSINPEFPSGNYALMISGDGFIKSIKIFKK